MGLIRGVTKKNYAKLAVGFCEMNDGVAHCICPKPWSQDNEPQQATPREWAAWLSYFKSVDVPIKFMELQGSYGNPFSVPSMWPHEFDVERTIADDHEAADAFMARNLS